MTNIGTIWLLASKEPFVIICGTSTNVPDAFRSFGRTTKKALFTLRSVTTGIKFWQDARSVVALVSSVTVDSWAIIWT